MRTLARRSVLLIVCASSFGVMAAPLDDAARARVYATVGETLTQYDADLSNATLTPRGTVLLPGYVQEAWRHPTKPVLYVAWSNGGPLYAVPGGAAPPAATRSGITSVAIDPTNGSLHVLGAPAVLRARPIYVTCDRSGAFLIVAYNDPSGVSVHRLRDDGTIGAEVAQSPRLDVGIYAHQVRVSPSNAAVFLPTRGNDATAHKAEDPGALKILRFTDGVLTNLASIAPNGGLHFRSRHIDFHPTRPWLFLTLESENRLQLYRRRDDDAVDPLPLFSVDTLDAGARKDPTQRASSVHVHPNGRFVYVANRASSGGENTIAAFAIDPQSGEPRRIGNVDSHGIQPRTFAIDATGRLLVTANQTSTSAAPANLSLFRIGADGRLTFARTYDMRAGDKPVLWVGIFER